MAARAALFKLLSEDNTLQSLGVENVYPTNAVDTPPEDCFLVIRWEPSTMAFKNVGSDRVSIWAHDRSRDYGRIDEVLQHLKELLPATIHLPGEDGQTLTTSEWLGEGPDLFDAGYQTVVRFVEFTVISR